jgi:hypothetical protein
MKKVQVAVHDKSSSHRIHKFQDTLDEKYKSTDESAESSES